MLAPAVFVSQKTKHHSIPLISVLTHEFSAWLIRQSDFLKQWLTQVQFKAESGKYVLVPNAEGQGGLQCVILGVRDTDDFWAFGVLASLPEGVYHLEKGKALKTTEHIFRAHLAFALGCYQFTTYKPAKPLGAQLRLPVELQLDQLTHFIEAIYLARNMINTPAEDMGPEDIEQAVKSVAKAHGAKVSVICGDALLDKHYPTMHRVGRSSTRAPRMVDLRWKSSVKKRLKRVTLVGKGVCFDSGGLDIKPATAMLLMKKDMAGSAMMLALAKLIMSHNLPIELRLLIGAVDNVISGNSYRPGDVIKTRSGKTVEVVNTDAEGRLVLCDLLTEACTEKPDLLIDCATLTGAGRVALGEDIPAFFTNQTQIANQLRKAAQRVNDPVWELPLVQDYQAKLKSEIADISNCSETPYGGAITAALFLQGFVDKDTPWLHFDTCAWHFKSKPGRPLGGDAFAIRAVFEMLCGR